LNVLIAWIESKTFKAIGLLAAGLSIACSIFVLVMLYSTIEVRELPVSSPSSPPTFVPASAPSKLAVRCRKLPTGVVNWGIAMQSTPDGLYLCFQQGGGQGMTEVTCVPIEECPR
jgi:hypothetical protein